MTEINKLTSVDTVTGSDQVPIYSSSNGDARKASMNTIRSYIGNGIASDTHSATSKPIPVDADELPLADSQASWVLKKLTWSNLKATLWTSWGALIFAGTSKTTPVDADGFAIQDSAVANATKKLTFANLWTWIKSQIATVGLTGNLLFTGTGNRITGDFSNATVSNRVMLQTSTVNGNSNVSIIPNGTSTNSFFKAYNASDPSNATEAAFGTTAVDVQLAAGKQGTGTYLPLTFYTNGSEKVRIDTAGTMTLNSGQLKFPATQNPSSDVNTLDDYEEGTWTPTLVLSTPGTSSFTYSIQTGMYTKIGRQVNVHFRIECSASSAGTGTGQLYVAGLPFSVSATTVYVAGVIGYAANWTTNFPTALLGSSGTTAAFLYATSPTSGSVALNQTNIGGAVIIYGALSYTTTT